MTFLEAITSGEFSLVHTNAIQLFLALNYDKILCVIGTVFPILVFFKKKDD